VPTSDIWDDETARHYDSDSADQFAPDVLDPAVTFLARLAGSGAALEFAVGTGRVAIPLAARGVPVTGVELSEAMVAQLRRKVDAATLPVVVGDMAITAVPGTFSLVYLVWNSISNLRTQDEQVECFRNAARHLAPGGRFVIELWVPPLRRLPPGQVAVPFAIGDGHVGFDTYDLVAQHAVSHHYRRRSDGAITYGSGNFRFILPSECDLMARLAGLDLERRLEGHVSAWRRPNRHG
jgi:SAM-dependent methyltransferase